MIKKYVVTIKALRALLSITPHTVWGCWMSDY